MYYIIGPNVIVIKKRSLLFMEHVGNKGFCFYDAFANVMFYYHLHFIFKLQKLSQIIKKIDQYEGIDHSYEQ